MKKLFVLFIIALTGCVVTFRAKNQKTAEREIQVGMTSPNSEYAKSQINTVDQIRDTTVTVNVKKDTTVHTKVTKDTINHFNVHHD